MPRLFAPVLAVTASFALISAPACSQPAEERAEICPDGYAALNAEAPQDAIAAFESCLNAQRYPWRVEAELRLRQGSAHLAEGEGQEALVAFNQILALAEDNNGNTNLPMLRRNRALAYFQLERPEDALADLQIAVNGAPQDVFIRVIMGASFFDLERYAEAVEAYDAAIRLDPNSVSGWSGRSAAFIELGLTDRAVDDAREAVGIAPDAADALNALCWALVKDGRASEGLDICDAAVEADPESGSITHSKAAALEQVGRTREARRLYARAYDLNPDSDTIVEDYERSRDF